MKTAKYRNVGIKHILINTDNDNERVQFADLHLLVQFVKQFDITIINLAQMPEYFQTFLKQ
jgi:hypothetical protein